MGFFVLSVSKQCKFSLANGTISFINYLSSKTTAPVDNTSPETDALASKPQDNVTLFVSFLINFSCTYVSVACVILISVDQFEFMLF